MVLGPATAQPDRPPKSATPRRPVGGSGNTPHAVATPALDGPDHLGPVSQLETGVGGAPDGFVGGDDQIIHQQERLDGPEPRPRIGGHLPDDLHDREIGIPGPDEGGQGEFQRGHGTHIRTEPAGLRDAPPYPERGVQGTLRIHLDHDLGTRLHNMPRYAVAAGVHTGCRRESEHRSHERDGPRSDEDAADEAREGPRREAAPGYRAP